MKRTDSSKSSRRFTSERSANNFAKKLGVHVTDLRGIEGAKSNFKVTYTKGQANKAHKNTPSNHYYDSQGYSGSGDMEEWEACQHG